MTRRIPTKPREPHSVTKAVAMLKKALIGSAVAVGLGTFLFGRDAVSYVRVGCHNVRNAVKARAIFGSRLDLGLILFVDFGTMFLSVYLTFKLYERYILLLTFR